MSDLTWLPAVYVEGGTPLISALIKEFGTEVLDPFDADIVMLTGGSDISPSLYGEEALNTTKTNPKRDAAEVSLIARVRNRAYKKNQRVAFIGICRGAQLLCTLSGGSLWQHVHNHGVDHTVKDLATNRIYKCSSTHHQQMRMPIPDAKVKFSILAIALDRNDEVRRETEKFGVVERPQTHDCMDIEAMWFEDTKSLCFQPHPEYLGYPQCKNLFMEYVRKIVLPSFESKVVN
jgi:GMP synthase-like glutamine amidotransferase